jgi:hypothetical protein
MASFAFIDGVVVVNSVTLSTFVTKATLNVTADELEDTAMGDTYKSRIGGLKDGSLTLEFNQDFAASAPDVSLWSLLGTVVTFSIKATSSANSATNPQYSGSVLISQHNPLDNGVGELGKLSVTWPTSGTISRATS